MSAAAQPSTALTDPAHRRLLAAALALLFTATLLTVVCDIAFAAVECGPWCDAAVLGLSAVVAATLDLAATSRGDRAPGLSVAVAAAVVAWIAAMTAWSPTFAGLAGPAIGFWYLVSLRRVADALAVRNLVAEWKLVTTLFATWLAVQVVGLLALAASLDAVVFGLGYLGAGVGLLFGVRFLVLVWRLRGRVLPSPATGARGRAAGAV